MAVGTGPFAYAPAGVFHFDCQTPGHAPAFQWDVVDEWSEEAERIGVDPPLLISAPVRAVASSAPHGRPGHRG